MKIFSPASVGLFFIQGNSKWDIFSTAPFYSFTQKNQFYNFFNPNFFFLNFKLYANRIERIQIIAKKSYFPSKQSINKTFILYSDAPLVSFAFKK